MFALLSFHVLAALAIGKQHMPGQSFRIYHLYTYHLYTYAQQMLTLQYVNGSRGTYEHFIPHINESRHTLSRFAVLQWSLHAITADAKH